MNFIIRRLFALLIMSVCIFLQGGDVAPDISREQAIAISAIHESKNNGVDIDSLINIFAVKVSTKPIDQRKLQKIVMEFDVMKIDKLKGRLFWSIQYYSPVPRPGGKIYVCIDSSSGEVLFEYIAK